MASKSVIARRTERGYYILRAESEANTTAIISKASLRHLGAKRQGSCCAESGDVLHNMRRARL